MGFQAQCDETRHGLRLTGDCRMTDAATLDRELARWRSSAGAEAVLDLAGSGEFDIGPAWLLHRALADLRAAGASVRIEGTGPGPFPVPGRVAGARAATGGRHDAATPRSAPRKAGQGHRGSRPIRGGGAGFRWQVARDRGRRLDQPQTPAHPVGRASCLRDGRAGNPGGRRDRVPDQRDLGLHRRAAIAAVRRARSTR